MSKKDYQAIARAVYETRQLRPAFSQEFDGEDSASDVLIGKLSRVFACDNHLFSRERFKEACETGTTRGMRK